MAIIDWLEYATFWIYMLWIIWFSNQNLVAWPICLCVCIICYLLYLLFLSLLFIFYWQYLFTFVHFFFFFFVIFHYLSLFCYYYCSALISSFSLFLYYFDTLLCVHIYIPRFFPSVDTPGFFFLRRLSFSYWSFFFVFKLGKKKTMINLFFYECWIFSFI
jgi:hypothetical protein